jgi:hypothetical protein
MKINFSSRRGIPDPIFVEVLLLEIMVEVFREAGLRLPKNVNQTLGVVAGIGLALAAVQTRLVSGASLVIVTIGAIASFSSPSFAVGIPWRILGGPNSGRRIQSNEIYHPFGVHPRYLGKLLHTHPKMDGFFLFSFSLGDLDSGALQ